MRETDPVRDLKGVGEKTAKTFAGMGIETIGDLLEAYPVNYEKYEAPVPVAEAESGQLCTLEGIFSSKAETRKSARGLVMTQVSLKDDSGICRLIWFRMPFLANQLKKGQEALARGRFQRGAYGPVMEQPKLYTREEYEERMRSLQPVYPLSAGLTNRLRSKLLAQALEGLDSFPDPLPLKIRQKFGLSGRRAALQEIHFPRERDSLLKARERLVFEEFFLFLLSIRRLKEGWEEAENRCPMKKRTWAGQLFQNLPYRLTGAQQRVWGEIEKDLEGGRRMSRLVQGDVGSGKTVLAQLALATAVENGYQGALMVPTEVLAAQHYEDFTQLFETAGLPVRCCLLTGAQTASRKKEICRAVEAGEADIVIGTHALIQENVRFHRLGLVVTDEQHRFGVRQREVLAEKGDGVHVLVMSATPIPRTLAIILYGDMDISRVDELPAGRRPIRNCVVDPSWRPKAFQFLRRQVEEGRQAYVICPMVEEGEGLDAENVADTADRLREALPPSFRIETLHGRMRPKEKTKRMEAFAAGEIDILVSTTVVEVGVNVPNATVMMVENAERFGLAQLHQLRGRVGRGGNQSYCIFMDGSGEGGKNKRLSVLVSSNDGFAIAAEDLKLRGPGDVFGIRQSGEMDFALGDIYTDAEVLQKAAEACGQVLAEDPGMEGPEYTDLRKKLEKLQGKNIPL